MFAFSHIHSSCSYSVSQSRTLATRVGARVRLVGAVRFLYAVSDAALWPFLAETPHQCWVSDDWNQSIMDRLSRFGAVQVSLLRRDWGTTSTATNERLNRYHAINVRIFVTCYWTQMWFIYQISFESGQGSERRQKKALLAKEAKESSRIRIRNLRLIRDYFSGRHDDPPTANETQFK